MIKKYSITIILLLSFGHSNAEALNNYLIDKGGINYSLTGSEDDYNLSLGFGYDANGYRFYSEQSIEDDQMDFGFDYQGNFLLLEAESSIDSDSLTTEQHLALRNYDSLSLVFVADDDQFSYGFSWQLPNLELGYLSDEESYSNIWVDSSLPINDQLAFNLGYRHETDDLTLNQNYLFGVNFNLAKRDAFYLNSEYEKTLDDNEFSTSGSFDFKLEHTHNDRLKTYFEYSIEKEDDNLSERSLFWGIDYKL